jgi:hypothetical protein
MGSGRDRLVKGIMEIIRRLGSTLGRFCAATGEVDETLGLMRKLEVMIASRYDQHAH